MQMKQILYPIQPRLPVPKINNSSRNTNINQMKRIFTTTLVASLLVLTGCVSSKKFKKMQADKDAQYAALDKNFKDLQASLNSCNDNVNGLKKDKDDLQKALDAAN